MKLPFMHHPLFRPRFTVADKKISKFRIQLVVLVVLSGWSTLQMIQLIHNTETNDATPLSTARHSPSQPMDTTTTSFAILPPQFSNVNIPSPRKEASLRQLKTYRQNSNRANKNKASLADRTKQDPTSRTLTASRSKLQKFQTNHHGIAVSPVSLPKKQDPDEDEASRVRSRKSNVDDDQYWLCGGCLLQPIATHENVATEGQGRLLGKNETIETCGSLMFQIHEQQGFSMPTAALHVARLHPEACRRCRPYSCPESERYFWYLDQAGPTVLAAHAHFFHGIPARYRAPLASLAQPGPYFEQHPQQIPSKNTYLFEYNPTLIQLPLSQIPPHLASEKPVYLASYRVSRYNFCYARRKEDIEAFVAEPFEAMALAILREDLSVIQQGIFQVSKWIRYEDPRLFALRGRIFMATFDQVIELWLVPPTSSDTADALKSISEDLVELEDVFGTSDMKITLRTFPVCCASPSCVGKNFNLFVDAHDNIMIETNPLAPHLVETINVDRSCLASRNTSHDFVVYQHDEMPSPSFYTHDEVLFPKVTNQFSLPYSRERGTACCLSIDDPRSTTVVNGTEFRNHTNTGKLLVGISHSKGKQPFPPLTGGGQYYSRLYAFEAAPPYRIVAVSGRFCLGSPVQGKLTDDEELQQNPHQAATKRKILSMKEPLNCPAVTFASGLTEKANDPDRVIISYGINDCTGRMVEVSKAELVHMLFDVQNRNRSSFSSSLGVLRPPIVLD